MNDSTPLPLLSHDVAQWPRGYQKVDFLLGSGTAEIDSDPAALDWGSDDFLWLWTRNEVDANGRPRQAWHLPATLSKWVLRGAVTANGGALVALAFTMQSFETSAGRVAAVVLGLGLLCAALATVLAYLNFQLAALQLPSLQLPSASRLAASFWLAAISCAGSYAALAVAAFCVLG